MVGGSGEISPLPPTIFVMITNQKWQLYQPSYPQSLRDSPGGACRTDFDGSGVSETTLHSVSPTLRLEPYCALRKNP